MRNDNDFIYLDDETLSKIENEAERIMQLIEKRKGMNLSNRDMSKRGFMCELVARLLLGLPLTLNDELDAGFDICYNGKYIDVKSIQIKESWSAFTKDNHDLKIYRFKNDKPHDFVYLFISSTENPKIYVIEGACTQGQLLKAISEDKSSCFFPCLHYAGEDYRGFPLYNDMVTVPNNWLPYRGNNGAYELLKARTFTKKELLDRQAEVKMIIDEYQKASPEFKASPTNYDRYLNALVENGYIIDALKTSF
ncbi:MAG: hypothetical protein IKE94_07440 [Aeriscardovia sp.]|nr:hypothetical protein [Aeriscardovia sp.]